MAARKATRTQHDRLAVILTGHATRAAAHLGALQALETAGLTPDVLVGVSGGAIAGALYAASPTAEAAREAVGALVEANSWQDLADLDYRHLLGIFHRPHEVNGLLRGEALLQALLTGPLGQRGFQHLDRPLFVLASDLNSGREVVFGPQTAEDGERPYQLFARSAADLERVNVAAACRASAATPGLFQPVSLDHHCLVDGTLRQGRALAVAAAQEGVGRILWLHAGLDENETFSLVTDFSGQSLAAGLMQALTVAAADQFDPHTGDPALEGRVVRFVNLGVSSVGAAELVKVQQVYESGRRTVAALLAAGAELFGPAEALQAALAQVTDEIDGPRWRTVVGAGGRDTLAVVDLLPTLQQEFGYEFDDYLTEQGLTRVKAKEPRATCDWATAELERQLGLGGLTCLYTGKALTYCWRGLTRGLSIAARAVGLPRAWDKLAEVVAATALTVGRTLGHKPAPVPPAPSDAAE